MGLLGAASAVGLTVGYKVAVTELPQTVAAFHALVGIAAVTTSIASFMIHPTPDGLHRGAAFLGAGVGSITFTGSIIAYTPLMSITNAISGITAVGGLLLIGGGVVPHSFA